MTGLDSPIERNEANNNPLSESGVVRNQEMPPLRKVTID
jgi:hypothetical protein